MLKNSRIILLLIITFVTITVYTQIPDIKNFFVKSGIISKENPTNIDYNNLQAFPYYESTELTSNTKSTTLPGPLTTNIEELKEYEPTETTIKQPNFDAALIISETNVYRSQNGLNNLLMNPILNKMAEEKLNDMFERGYFDHISPVGVTIENIAEENKYEYLVIGENLALGGFKTAKDVIVAWSESEPHRKNMLDDRYTEIGVAVKKGSYKGFASTIIVQHFGTPVDSCPPVSKQTKDSIDNIQEELKIMKEKIEDLKIEIENNNNNQDIIEEHNSLVSQYNKKLSKLKNIVEDYNAQVESFNKCVENVGV